MTDFWPDFTNDICEENKAIHILRDQARALEKKTNKKVKATFSKIEYRDSLAGATAMLGATLLSLSSLKEEIIDDELKNKNDINDLYKISQYKFEIFNSKYRFRLFVLNFREVFPIEIILDEGIHSEIYLEDETNRHLVNSNNELEKILSLIFTCKKVRTVISQMMRFGE